MSSNFVNKSGIHQVGFIFNLCFRNKEKTYYGSSVERLWGKGGGGELTERSISGDSGLVGYLRKMSKD